jgi:uncharacterized protein YhjY with autotransporter beta-barrel domain
MDAAANGESCFFGREDRPLVLGSETMNTLHFDAPSVRTSVASRSGLLRLGLLATLLVVGSAWTQSAPAASGVTLTPVSPAAPASGVLDVQPGTAITLSVHKQLDGTGMPNEAVDWNVSGPGSASLTSTQSMTSVRDDTHEAGIASTDFTARKPGSYVITARTQKNPGCVPAASCATFIRTQFTLRIAGAGGDDSADDHTGRDIAIAAAAAGAAIAVLANNNGQHREPTPDRTLLIASGDLQHGPPNAPLPSPLAVLAQNNGNPVGSVLIHWSASGGAILNSPISFTDSNGIAGIHVVSMGPGPGPVTVTATRDDEPSASVQFTLTVDNPSLIKVSGDGQSAPTSTQVPNPLVVEALLGSSPQSGVHILWSVTSGDASIDSVSNGGLTDAGGLSSATIDFGPTPGPVVITATRADFPLLSQSFSLTSTLTRTLTIVSGDDQTAAPNTPLPSPLVVNAQNNGNNIAGVTINWSATGGATLSSATSITNGSGQASVTVTSVGPGPDPVIVTATRADDASATVQFHENIIPPVLTKTQGDNQTGAVNTAAAVALQVKLVDGGGVPVSGQTISWNVTSGSASLSSPTSVTDGAGFASVNFSYGSTAGPITIHASAYSGSQSVDFSETAVTASSVQIIAGNNQTGAAGSTLPIPLTVHLVPPAGFVGQLSGQPINFSVTSGTGTLSVTSATTDVNGDASTQLTLGLTPGAVTVLAQVPNGGPSATFNETISGSLVATSLTIVSGNQQALTPGTASQPMVVQLKAGATPLAGMTINWGTSSGSLSAGSSVTDATGHASVTLTLSTGGAVTVTGTFNAIAQYTGSSVTFTQNSTLASLPAATTNEESVAVALDNACADLQSIASRTPEQQDLLNQCLALTASGGVAPAAVTNAIEQLVPKVAQTQTKTSQTAVAAQFNNLKGRITALRSGTFGSSFNGLSLNGSNGSFPIGQAATSILGFADQPDSSKKEVGADFSRWGFFASGNIGRASASPTANSPAYHLDVDGLTAGVDYRQSDRLILGAALGYTRQNTDLVGGAGSVDMHGFSLSGYSTWYQPNSWYIDGVITLSHNSFDHRRRIAYSLPLPGGGSTIVNQEAKASTSGSDASGTLTFGKDFQNKAWQFGVYGRGQYSRQRFDGFQEQLDASLAGSGLGLRVESRNVTALSSILGGKVNFTHSTDWGVVIPHFEVEWQHEYRGDPDSFRAFFIDDPSGTPIVITGDATDTNYFRTSLGTSFVFPKGRSGFILWEKVLGRTGITQDTYSLGFRMEF